MMLRLPKGMSINQYFERQKKRREASKAKRKFLDRDKPRTIKYSKTMLRGILDDVFSVWIKVRDKRRFNGICSICNRRPIEVCYHFVPKCTGNFLVRWLDDNSCGACNSCNNGERWHRQRYREIHIKMVGLEERERIEKLGRGPSNMDIGDMLDLLASIRKKIAHVGNIKPRDL